jgi:hypothetical protein
MWREESEPQFDPRSQPILVSKNISKKFLKIPENWGEIDDFSKTCVDPSIHHPSR